MFKKKNEILDCTIRDGGYYNNWDFENDMIQSYITSVQKLPIDIIEIGYRSSPQTEYLGKFFYLPDFVIDEIVTLNYNKKRLALMFNEKTTRPENVGTLLKGLEGKIQLIRLAVDPSNFDRAITLAKAIKSLGFEVAFNVMYMSRFYKDVSFLSKLSQLNGIVQYINLVDSYGGMIPQEVKELIENAKSSCSAKIGFHGHNNLELVFANSLIAIESGCDIIDSTILGMGRGAGNLKTELILTYLASKEDVEFDFNVLSNLVEKWTPLQEEFGWGTNLPYMVSGANSLSQKDVMNWVTQRYYSFNSIIRALNNQKKGEKDNIQLPEFNPNHHFDNVIIIGGGPSAVSHSTAIKSFIKQLENACIIHASSKNAKSYEELDCKQFYCLVGNEGHRLESVFNDFNSFKGECILPSYPRKMGTYLPERVKNRSFELSAVTFSDKYKDAHTALAIQAAFDLSANNIYIAGYDGYSSQPIGTKEMNLVGENEYLFQMASKKTEIISITSTNYSLQTKSVYSLISNPNEPKKK